MASVVYSDGMVTGPVPPAHGSLTEGDKRIDARLREMEAEFPGWDFHPVFGGWEAVPSGTPVIRSADLDGLAEKLRDRGSR